MRGRRSIRPAFGDALKAIDAGLRRDVCERCGRPRKGVQRVGPVRRREVQTRAEAGLCACAPTEGVSRDAS